MKSIYKVCVPAIAALFVLSPVAAAVQSPSAIQEDKVQLKWDESALQREEKQLKSDQVMMKSDRMEGKMAAESRDAERIYRDRQGIKGENKDISADQLGSPQMKEDKSALLREEQRLGTDESTMKTDKAEGKMAAESRDSEKVYKDSQAIKAEKQDIAADEEKLKSDQKNGRNG
jgi:hypothetical protein